MKSRNGKSMYPRIALAALVASLGLSQSAIGSDSGTNASEFSALAAGTWKADSVFMVSALGGIVAVPNRYQVNTHFEEDSYDLELISPNGVLLGKKDFGLGINSGEISFGRLDKLPEGRKLASGDPLQKFECHGLDIEIRESDKTGMLFVIFEKGQDYMTVFDRDQSLWKEILAVYGRSVHASDVCPDAAQVDRKI